jgi:succinoglycan biosynthesis protein ExoM
MKYVNVCICTYKRPSLLFEVLKALTQLNTDDLFKYSIIVIDNDAQRSGLEVVNKVKNLNYAIIEYFVEPEQNIALARNRAIFESTKDFLAFLDDDEIPSKDWLLNLYKTCESQSADGILGPVVSKFHSNPPAWIIKGEFFDNPKYPTGYIMRHWKETRSSNFFIRRDILDRSGIVFDPSYGISGGEDTDFFKRLLEKGARFVWCNEAVVYEIIGQERCLCRWLLKRAFRGGSVFSRIYLGHRINIFKRFVLLLWAIVGICLFGLFLPVTLLLGRQHRAKCLMKLFGHLGKIMGIFGLKVKGY